MIIKRKYYTDYEELDQKEFGIVSDLYHSTPKKVYKKYAGRARSKVAKGIGKLKDYNKNKSQSSLFDYVSDVDDSIDSKDIINNLIRNNRDRTGTRVILDKDSSATLSSTLNSDATKGLAKMKYIAGEHLGDKKMMRQAKKLLNSANKDKSQIFLRKKAGAEELAHEFGHQISNKGLSGKLKKKISDLANKERQNQNYLSYVSGTSNIDYNNMNKRQVAKEFLKRYKAMKLIKLDEKFATDNAIKELKKAGANKEQLKRAKRKLKKAGKTYKYSGRDYYLDPLYQKIQLPKRRSSGATRI